MNLSIYSNNQTPMFRSSCKRVPIKKILNKGGQTPRNTLVANNSTNVIEALAELVRRKSSLATNQSIQTNKYDILVKLSQPGDFRGISLAPYSEEKAGARLKFLKMYSNNKLMRKNPLISERIGILARAIKKYSQAKCAEKMLKNGVKIQDAKYFDRLENMLMYNIQPELITKIMSNEKLYKNIEPSTLLEIRGTRTSICARIGDILNKYLSNYIRSEVITAKLNSILEESFNQLDEDPVRYALRKFRNLAQK